MFGQYDTLIIGILNLKVEVFLLSNFIIKAQQRWPADSPTNVKMFMLQMLQLIVL